MSTTTQAQTVNGLGTVANIQAAGPGRYGITVAWAAGWTGSVELQTANGITLQTVTVTGAGSVAWSGWLDWAGMQIRANTSAPARIETSITLTPYSRI